MIYPASFMFWNRPNFRGLNDKYLEHGSRSGITPISGVQAAIQGNAPYDAVGGAMTENYRDLCMQRLSRYRTQWKFYNGDHFDYPYEDGELKAITNFCKLVVDKSTSFFLAKGWEIKSGEGNEQVADVLNDVWKANGQMALSTRALQFGGVNGDCYILVTVQTTDQNRKSLPKDEQTVRLYAIDPKYCHPFFSPGDPQKLEAIMIQFPTTAPDDPSTNILYTLYITPDYFDVYHNEERVSRLNNPFGEVNVVHYKNTELANSCFGVGDIDDVIPLNEEYNIVMNSIRRTIKYHGEPTTIIFGARVSDLEKGAKKVWSNLPKDAKVENLKLDGDLQGSMEYLDKLEDQILKLADIPKMALESADRVAVSNTSGIAIEMLYQPLVEKTARKRVGFSKMVEQVNRLILIAEEKIIGTDISALADEPESRYESYAEYTSPLPRDLTAETNNALNLLKEKVWSRAEVARRVGGVPDMERLALEITADTEADLVLAYENQRAALGVRPSPLAAFLGSINLNEDLQPIAQKVAAFHSKRPGADANPLQKPKTRVLTAGQPGKDL